MQSPFFIPGWKIVGIIGGGSFGSVYEIKRDLPNIQECAALKVISIPEEEDIYSIDAVGERDRTARGSDRKTGERSMSSFCNEVFCNLSAETVHSITARSWIISCFN